MPEREAPKWKFKSRFRRKAFGWKSQPAMARIKEAVAEIKRVAKTAPSVGASGAIDFLERLSPAIESVDSSSGAIGRTVNEAIAVLVPIISTAPVDSKTRDAWLNRLWEAYQNDDIPYIERLGHYWGDLCGSRELASAWADRLIGMVHLAWSPDPNLRGYFKGITNCLSALLTAERFNDVLGLLEIAPYKFWHYHQYGVRALAAMGRTDDAIRYARDCHDGNSSAAFASLCEELLLASGRITEAYQNYAFQGNQSGTYLATFRAIVRKYPHKSPAEILAGLAKTTPGNEGKWFAAAKDACLYDEALALARSTPCDPRTLTRAARDYAEKEPAFAVGAGLLALYWLVQGHGYEVTAADVWAAYRETMAVAERFGNAAARKEVTDLIRKTVASDRTSDRFVLRILRKELQL